MAKWIAAENVRAGLRKIRICPNVTGRGKDRIAQSKLARAGSLAIIVDKSYVARTCILQVFVCLFVFVLFAVRCRVVFPWRYVCFVLIRFCLSAFIEAAAIRSIVLR